MLGSANKGHAMLDFAHRHPFSEEALSRDITFHHLGIATENIDAESALWIRLGYRREGEPFSDRAQGTRGQFMTCNGHRIELIEALEGSSTLEPWLKRGAKLYHLGYLVNSFAETLASFVADGGIVARGPLRSAYFKSQIAFVMTPGMVLLELIEAESADRK